MKVRKTIRITLGALGIFLLAGTASAFPMVLTSEGLGIESGNYGHEFAVNDYLTLSGKTLLDTDLVPDGVSGTVHFASHDYGVGIRGYFGHGSGRIDSSHFLGNESLELNLARMTNGSEVSIGLNKFAQNDDLVLELLSGDRKLTIDDQSEIDRAFEWAGGNHGMLHLGGIADVADFGMVDRISVKSARGHFYVNKFATKDGDSTNPVPEPASLVLLGTGLLGAFGAKRLRRRS